MRRDDASYLLDILSVACEVVALVKVGVSHTSRRTFIGPKVTYQLPDTETT